MIKIRAQLSLSSILQMRFVVFFKPVILISLLMKTTRQRTHVRDFIALIIHVFHVYHLHKVIANSMPKNIRSGILLERFCFEKEGYARNYLMISDK